MAIHKPWDRDFIVLGGSVMTSGFSLNLAEGQFGIFNVSKQTPKGAVAVESFKGYGKDTYFELRLGNRQKLTRTTSDKMYSSYPFKVSDIVDLQVSAPKRTEMKVDELTIGYDGINPDTSIKLFPGEHKEINIELEGKALEYLGVPEGIANIIVPLDTLSDYGTCGEEVDLCEEVDMLPIINNAVQYLKDYEFRGGVKLTDYVEVTPIIDLDGVERTGSLVQIKFELTVCDTGDKTALALVQQGVPDATVSVKKRVGAMTTYEVTLMQEVGGAEPSAPGDYEQTLASVIKGCEDCPDGYTEVEGGQVYAVLIEDDGADLSSTVEGLANAVEGTAVKGDAQSYGVGMYTVVLSEKLSDADFNTFITANPTATVNYVGEVASICTNDVVTTVSWVESGRCTFTTSPWEITLADNECGESRLAELQAFYPDLTITEVEDSEGGCRRKYATTGITNVVCTQCDPIYQDIFTGEAPASYDGVKWVSTATPLVGTGGNFGIRLKGKVFKLASGEALRGKIGYIEDSVKIRATGGYVTDFNWSTTMGRTMDKPFHVDYLSKYEPRTHVLGNALDDERRSRTFFTGRLIDHGYMGRILTGNESNIVNLDAQYVDYAVTLRRNIYSQGLSQRLEENITYHIKVEVGRHSGVEEVLNSLAAANKIEGVKAFPVAVETGG